MNRNPWGALLLAASIVLGAGDGASEETALESLERQFRSGLADGSAVQLAIGRAGRIRMLLDPTDPQIGSSALQAFVWVD